MINPVMYWIRQSAACLSIVRLLISVALLSLLSVVSVAATAQEQGTSSVHSSIPFKTEPSPIESNGGNLIVALLVLVLGASGVLFVLRRRLPQGPGQKRGRFGLSFSGGGLPRRVQIVEQTRLNPRCTLYVIEHNGREILLGQCGDSLSVIDAMASTVPSTTDSLASANGGSRDGHV